MFRAVALALGGIGVLLAQDPYNLLKTQDYDGALAAFTAALAKSPADVALRKDYAYALLKVGESDTARNQFERIQKDHPDDWQAGLEYGFLCAETKRIAEARRLFDRLRQAAPEPMRTAAKEAFERIDTPLVEGIARWKRATELGPNLFSNHQELAQLAEQRSEFALAEQHYFYAWKLRNDMREFLLAIGRVRIAKGDRQSAMAPLLAASRGAEPRIADKARELLPERYPYVSEFTAALELDAGNAALRRELAFLYLAMNQPDSAEKELEILHREHPEDRLATAQLGLLYLARQDERAVALLESILGGTDDELTDRVRTALRRPQTLRRREETPTAKVNEEARDLAAKSLEKGYLKDAVRYLRVVHETDPIDFETMLRLGWANNVLRQDAEAVKWFRMARKSPDGKIADEADQAYRNLLPGVERFRTTIWTYPFYSSRWSDAFGYGQAKTEMRVDGLPVRPYVSARFIGDVRRSTEATGTLPALYLSENSFIFALGLATPVYHHAMAWFEAGESLRFLGRGGGTGLLTPDYRGGVSYNRGWGRMLGAESGGWFAETADDGVYVSRFNKDALLYSQNRTGYTFTPEPMNFQLYWSWNTTFDAKGYSWANFVETGPGVRFRFDSMPKSMFFTFQALRGNYLVHDATRKANYNDFRAGLWYAFTR